MLHDSWLTQPIHAPDPAFRATALKRQGQLTKPAGSLGDLETIAVDLAAIQRLEKPSAARAYMTIFAADHGVTSEGVSAFPSEVTAQMVYNFAHNGAAISALCREQNIQLSVVNVGVESVLEPLDAIINAHIAAGTQNIVQQAAMTPDQLIAALNVGRDAYNRAQAQGCDIFMAGEMGIGNTTSASALTAALLDLSPQSVCGSGTGLDGAGIARKIDVVGKAIERMHADTPSSTHEPFEILRQLGGLEIAAIVGAYIAAAQGQCAIIVDGFIATAAALVATQVNQGVRDYMLFGHRSREQAHTLQLEALNAQPILDLGMRLGEGSGAATALSIVRLALATHNNMATFAEAGVADA